MIQRLDDPLLLPLVPPGARAAVVTLWKLDARLGEMARAGKEPALRQIRLKWWEDQLAALTPAMRPPEPLLGEVAATLVPQLAPDRLAELAGCWSDSVANGGAPTGQGALLFDLTATLLDHAPDAAPAKAGEGWAQVETLLAGAAAADDPRWRAIAAVMASLPLRRLPRPLAALTGVARRIASQHGRRSPGREQAVMFRIGLLGF